MRRAFAYIGATSILAGTIIGAGMFALPYLFSRVGFGLGLVYVVFAVLIFLVKYIMYADIMARTNIRHRFVGYVREYFGKGFGVFALFIAVVEMLVVLAIYLVLAVSFFDLIAPQLTEWARVLIVWGISSSVIFLRMKRIASFETFITLGMIAIVAFIFLLALFRGTLHEVTKYAFIDMRYAFLPIAPILFAFAGRPAIASLIEYSMSVNNGAFSKIFVKRAIIAGTVIPAFVYILFVFGILWLSTEVSDNAVSGLIGNMPRGVLWSIGVLGLFSLWSSYIVIGRNVKQILNIDCHLSSFVGGSIVVFTPLIIYALSASHFIGLVALTGGVFLSLEGIFIILMWRKERQRQGVIELLPLRFGNISVIIIGVVLCVIFIGELLRVTNILPSF